MNDVAHAVLGKDAEEFLGSEVGRYIKSCVDKARDEALEKLVMVDASDTEGVRGYQNEVKVVDMVMGWLVDAVVRGRESLRKLEEGYDE